MSEIIGRCGKRGRVWHFWHRLYDSPLGNYYRAACGIETRTIKKPQPSEDWKASRPVCQNCLKTKKS